MNLKEIIKSVEKHEIDISVWLDGFSEKLSQFVLAHNHYWGLAAYIDLYEVKHVLELGTCTGSSAVIMARAGAVVDTYDLADIWELDCLPENVNRHLVDDPSYIHSLDLDPYDMIFVDVDHTGKEEQKIHEKFVAEYHGIVFYDDIWLYKEMISFWKGIEQEKQTCLWNTTSGFGAVRY